MLDEIVLFLKINSESKCYKYIRCKDLGKRHLSGPRSDPDWDSNQLYRAGIEPSRAEKKMLRNHKAVLLKNTSLT